MKLLDRILDRFAPPDLDDMERCADRLAAELEAADARTPPGQWTAQDVQRYDMDQVQAAITAGHLRDLGIAASPGARPCGLHGDACDLRAAKGTRA